MSSGGDTAGWEVSTSQARKYKPCPRLFLWLALDEKTIFVADMRLQLPCSDEFMDPDFRTVE